MLNALDLRGKVVAEPHAGSGNLVLECLIRGAEKVLGCEIEPKLRDMLNGSEAARTGRFVLIGDDFLQAKPEQFAAVQAIVMNPPFSNGATHLLHAWRVAPPSCKIVCLVSSNTIHLWHHGSDRRELRPLIEAYGSTEDLGECFRDAERSTGVNVHLVRLTKPSQDYDAQFEDFFMGPDEVEAEGYGIIKYNPVRAAVQKYVDACNVFDEQLKTAAKLQEILEGIYTPTKDRWGSPSSVAVMITTEGRPVAANDFKKDLQRQYWQWIINEMGLARTATAQLRKDIEKFVEEQTQVPFTMRNIYHMLQIIAGTHQNRMDQAIMEVFDEFTKYTKENRWNVEGFVTNEQYFLDRKFIVTSLTTLGGGNTVNISLGGYGKSRREEIEDLIRVLCSLSGKPFEDKTVDGKVIPGMQKPECGYYYIPIGTWHNWGFFRFKVHKKGTGHFEFLDIDDWARFNREVARIKGMVLPEQMSQKKKKGRGKVGVEG